ncbi:hypothetical protein LCGC14_3092710 [marine sediment metagenome]|uniref:Uncharacterized protein n=1 Tax=marine sediment metagenome TaxID=412755 RepID=A0A0F8YHG3_9ZZZZ
MSENATICGVCGKNSTVCECTHLDGAIFERQRAESAEADANRLYDALKAMMDGGSVDAYWEIRDAARTALRQHRERAE